MGTTETNVRVSIVCAWFNRAEYLSETLDSIISQNYPSFEVILVNDGSTDPRVSEILARYQLPNLRVIEQANTGFVMALRRAIEESKGEYIAIQGAGDVSLPSRIAAQAAVLDAEESVAIVGCGRYRTTVGGPRNGERATSLSTQSHVDQRYLMEHENPISHGEAMFRRSVYQSVGGYRPFFKFAQDIDLWLRMTRNCDIRLVPDVLYDRRVFYSDGVANDRSKVILQHALCEFAKQCEQDHARTGRDMLERYGPSGALFNGTARRSSSRFIAMMAIKCCATGNIPDAIKFSNLASDQDKNLRTLLAGIIVSACAHSSLLSRAFANLLRHHPKYAEWTEKK